DGILVSEVAVDERLVDQDHPRSAGGVAIREHPPTTNGDMQRFKIAGADIAKLGLRRLAVGGRSSTGDGEEAMPTPILKRKELNESGGTHSRNSPVAILQFLNIPAIATWSAVLGKRNSDAQREYVVRHDSGRRGLEMQK